MDKENTSTEEVKVETTEVTTTEESTEEVDEKALTELFQKQALDAINAKADDFAKTFLAEIGKQRAKAIDTGVAPKDEHREIAKQFITAVVSRDVSALKAMNTGTDASGGYTVPLQISNEIIRKANTDYGVARRLFSVRNFSGPGNEVQLFTEGDEAVAFWTDEGAKKSSSGITLGIITLGLKKLAVFIPFTYELLKIPRLI